MLFLQGLHRARKRLQKYEEKSNLQNFSLRDPENTAEMEENGGTISFELTIRK